MKKTSLTALGGVIAALSLAVMFLAGMIPGLTYIVPAFTGLLLILPLSEEKKKSFTLLIYLAVSLLTLFLLPDKEISLLYIFFFGYYPILFSVLEGRNRVFSWTLKIAVFNGSMILVYELLKYIFHIPVENMDLFGKWTFTVLLLTGNVVFILYDRVLNGFMLLYRRKYSGKVRKLFGK